VRGDVVDLLGVRVMVDGGEPIGGRVGPWILLRLPRLGSERWLGDDDREGGLLSDRPIDDREGGGATVEIRGCVLRCGSVSRDEDRLLIDGLGCDNLGCERIDGPDDRETPELRERMLDVDPDRPDEIEWPPCRADWLPLEDDRRECWASASGLSNSNVAAATTTARPRQRNVWCGRYWGRNMVSTSPIAGGGDWLQDNAVSIACEICALRCRTAQSHGRDNP